MKMITLVVDGSGDTGAYRVECYCGDVWTGRGELSPDTSWSPAMPIAECVVHVNLEHPEEQINIRWTPDFEKWLQHYWEFGSLREATKLSTKR